MKGMTDLEIAAQLGTTARNVFSERRRHGLLTGPEKEALRKSRRTMLTTGLVLGGIAVAIGGGIAAFHYFTKPVSYEDAVKDPGKRQAHIDGIVQGKIPPYVAAVQYETPQLLDKLAKHGHNPKLSFAYTIAIKPGGNEKDWELATEDQFGKGAKSLVIVFKDLYEWRKDFKGLDRVYPTTEFYKDFDVISRNVILKNEFIDAKHINTGIPGYPIEMFRDSNGRLNGPLYTLVHDLCNYKAPTKPRRDIFWLIFG
ncbi:hypothetical protein HYY71_02920 [Candidatus Woesearchaeota archaeon]|nr:hypothetical protein [Candidatus Woesearchaeota archaeon]